MTSFGPVRPWSLSHSQGTLIAVRISLNTYKEFESGALDAIQAKPINQPMIGGMAEIFELSPIYKLITAGAQTGPDPARYLKTNYLVHYRVFDNFCFVFILLVCHTLSCHTVCITRYAVEIGSRYILCFEKDDDDDNGMIFVLSVFSNDDYDRCHHERLYR